MTLTPEINQHLKLLLKQELSRNEAIEQLYILLLAPMTTAAKGMLKDDEAKANDIVHDTFVKFCSLSRYDKIDRLDNFLFSTMFNLIRNFNGKSSSQKEEMYDILDEYFLTHSIEKDLDFRISMKQGVGKLTKKEQDCFLVIHLLGYTQEEAARLLDLTTRNCVKHFRRALLNLYQWAC